MDSTDRIGFADFPREIRNVILEYLNVEDILWLRKVARGEYLIKGFWKETDKLITKRILSSLVAACRPLGPLPCVGGDEIDKQGAERRAERRATCPIQELIISTGAEISGSFLLHCINEDIPYSDIDIYVHEKEADKWEKFFATSFGVEPEIVRMDVKDTKDIEETEGFERNERNSRL